MKQIYILVFYFYLFAYICTLLLEKDMQQYNQGELLRNVNFPEDIKKLSKNQLSNFVMRLGNILLKF